MDALRAEAEISIDLPHQRSEVAAIGPSVGPEDAAITLIEFSDYQCPYCSRAVPTLKALIENHPDDLRVVYRHLPLSFHAQARGAAEASVCADEQGLFWEYHDLLFANQRALQPEQLLGYATGLGMNAAELAANPRLSDWVVHDLNHIHQVAKCLGNQYRDEIGPWRKNLTFIDR